MSPRYVRDAKISPRYVRDAKMSPRYVRDAKISPRYVSDISIIVLWLYATYSNERSLRLRRIIA
jgi:hypothetical protein